MEYYGTVTNALQKPLKSVPTIVFNNQYKKEDNDLAQNNFVSALCQYIEHGKPAECSRNAAFGSHYVSLVVVCVGYLFNRVF